MNKITLVLKLIILHPIKYKAIEVSSEADLASAKKLHASRYLQVGFIDESEIEEGVISHASDPHQAHSKYFALKNRFSGEVVATSRQIMFEEEKKLESFPVLTQVNIWPDYSYLLDQGAHENIVEISGLSKKKGLPTHLPIYLYKKMWQYSVLNDHHKWLMALDVRLNKRLEAVFGKSMQQIGDVTSYKGGDIVPAILEPYEVLRSQPKGSFSVRIQNKIMQYFFIGASRSIRNKLKRGSI